MSDILDSFDAQVRRAELERLVAAEAAPAIETDLNMHFHSFYSYNAEGWSPSRIAWESRQRGLQAAGLCDFDVLDGLEEFREHLGGELTITLINGIGQKMDVHEIDTELMKNAVNSLNNKCKINVA